MLGNSSERDSSAAGGDFSLDVRTILSLRPRMEANSSSAGPAPGALPFPSDHPAGTLGKVAGLSLSLSLFLPSPPFLKL